MNHKFTFFILLCFGLALVLSGCAEKSGQTKKQDFELDKDFQRGPLEIHLRLSKSSITIAQTLLFQLEAKIQDGYELTMPKIDPVLATQNFGLLDFRNLGDRLDENNNLVRTYNYKLEPFVSGTFPIPPLVFEFTDTVPDDPCHPKTYRLETEPIDIEVTSLLGEDLAELVIADIAGVVELPNKASLWPLIIIAGVILTAAIIITFIYLRRKRPAGLVRFFKPAHEIAYQRLTELVADKLTDTGRIKEFYQRISDILRHYIEDRFDLRAPERTTEEFLFELSCAQTLPDSDKNSLAQFLQHCDLVKFAKHQPTTEQIQKTFDLVKNFIEKTKSDQHQIDVTETENNQQTIQTGSV